MSARDRSSSIHKIRAFGVFAIRVAHPFYLNKTLELFLPFAVFKWIAHSIRKQVGGMQMRNILNAKKGRFRGTIRLLKIPSRKFSSFFRLISLFFSV